MKNKRNCLLLNHWLATAFIDLFVDVFSRDFEFEKNKSKIFNL
jgi:hypothetical protein